MNHLCLQLFRHALIIEYFVSRENIETLQEEFQFWETQRSIEITDFEGKQHRVAQYNAQVGEPRPESFRFASPILCIHLWQGFSGCGLQRIRRLSNKDCALKQYYNIWKCKIGYFAKHRNVLSPNNSIQEKKSGLLMLVCRLYCMVY